MTDNGPARPTDHLNLRGLDAKREYVRGLERRRDPESLSLLAECLCDESGYLRDLAAQVFVKLGREAEPVLLPLLDQGLWYTRTNTAAILGHLGSRAAVPVLLRLTGDPNRTVVESARDALLAIARAGGAPAVAWWLHRRDDGARRAQLEPLAARDAAVAARIQQLQHHAGMMTADDPLDLPTDPPPPARGGGDGANAH